MLDYNIMLVIDLTVGILYSLVSIHNIPCHTCNNFIIVIRDIFIIEVYTWSGGL